MCTLETGILCVVWNDTFQPFSSCSLSLQCAQTDFSTAVNLMSFYESEIQGTARTDNHEYVSQMLQKTDDM